MNQWRRPPLTSKRPFESKHDALCRSFGQLAQPSAAVTRKRQPSHSQTLHHTYSCLPPIMTCMIMASNAMTSSKCKSLQDCKTCDAQLTLQGTAFRDSPHSLPLFATLCHCYSTINQYKGHNRNAKQRLCELCRLWSVDAGGMTPCISIRHCERERSCRPLRDASHCRRPQR